MRIRTGLLLLAVAGLALTGCDSGGSPQAGTSSTIPVVTTAAAPTTAAPTPTTSTGASATPTPSVSTSTSTQQAPPPPPQPTLPPAPPIPQTNEELIAYVLAGNRVNAANWTYNGGTVWDTTVYFTSPSGNINCWLAGDNLICELGQTFWPAISPGYCYGASLFDPNLVWMDDGYFQRGDCTNSMPLTPIGKALPYGSTIFRSDPYYYGPDNVACRVESSGAACADLVRGSGFFVSREQYIAFPFSGDQPGPQV